MKYLKSEVPEYVSSSSSLLEIRVGHCTTSDGEGDRL